MLLPNVCMLRNKSQQVGELNSLIRQLGATETVWVLWVETVAGNCLAFSAVFLRE